MKKKINGGVIISIFFSFIKCWSNSMKKKTNKKRTLTCMTEKLYLRMYIHCLVLCKLAYLDNE